MPSSAAGGRLSAQRFGKEFGKDPPKCLTEISGIYGVRRMCAAACSSYTFCFKTADINIFLTCNHSGKWGGDRWGTASLEGGPKGEGVSLFLAKGYGG
jgi:hypothetical protein